MHRADEEKRKRKAVRVVFRLADEDVLRGGRLLAGGLAYRLFLWLLPAALVGTSLVRLFSDARGRPTSEAAQDVGLGGKVADIVRRATEQTGKAAPVLLVIGLVILLWSSRDILKSIRLVSTIAWGMRPPPAGSRIWAPLATTVILFSFAVQTILIAPLYRWGIVGDIVATSLVLIGSTAIGTWVAYKLPHPADVDLGGFVPGAILFAVSLWGLRIVGAHFTGGLINVDDLYGALGVATVLMASLYLFGRLIVLGLMLNPAIQFSDRSELPIDEEGTPSSNAL